MELAGAIAIIIVPVFLKWLSLYLEKDRTYENLQIGRVDIQSGNIDAVEQRIDRMLADIKAGDSVAGKPDDEDTRRRLQELL